MIVIVDVVRTFERGFDFWRDFWWGGLKQLVIVLAARAWSVLRKFLFSIRPKFQVF
jgi:hypothetical protein